MARHHRQTAGGSRAAVDGKPLITSFFFCALKTHEAFGSSTVCLTRFIHGWLAVVDSWVATPLKSQSRQSCGEGVYVLMNSPIQLVPQECLTNLDIFSLSLFDFR